MAKRYNAHWSGSRYYGTTGDNGLFLKRPEWLGSSHMCERVYAQYTLHQTCQVRCAMKASAPHICHQSTPKGV